MRRREKEVVDRRIIEALLEAGQVCRLAMVDDGEPYLVPLNYGYAADALFIHSAAVGRKMDVLRRNNRVCFEIESPVTIVQHPEPCHWGARARSVIGYGRVEIVTDPELKRAGFDVIMRHYGKRDANLYDEKQLAAVVVLKVVIESMSCKQLGQWE